MERGVCVSDQFSNEAACELSRIATSNAVIKITARTRGSSETGIDVHSEVALTRIALFVAPRDVFTKQFDDQVQELLKECQKYYSGLGISPQERMQIKQALNFAGSGHWYKCPRGHVYAIGNCGLANQVSRCPEAGCGAVIGGHHYQLDGSNTLATEME
ncbi:hypothetical protein HAZT_HAZT003220 [Hyalella azteca]|uniref:RZ-type domain-containing protein n=1 Tax=Hyalella azteca TaxID=294128 RepID=A0A6A0H7Z4_HYAAZ|nr:hypothetical protein HAZT_HAZT003220 [Hyalella azteca]